MKGFVLCLITVFVFSFGSAAQVVKVKMSGDVVKRGDKAEFIVQCASEQDLEVVVFTGDHLALHQQSTLLQGDNPFVIEEKMLPAGKYFILVTGNGVHVEKEFLVK